MISLLDVDGISVQFRMRSGNVEAVRDFTIRLGHGESFGLVGESGCGKSTVAMAVMQHLGPSGYLRSGRILFEGQDLSAMSPSEIRRLRGSRIAMVYQEPMSALNPSLTIGRQLREVLTHKEGTGRAEAQDRITHALSDVRIASPEAVLARYPHQLSGGQQQRVVIAMALLCKPALLILDEPTTALDVTVQAAITRLLDELRRKYGTAMIYISHNLALVSQVCDRIAVMYLGEIVESGDTKAVFSDPRHPYTRGLLASIPRADTSTRAPKGLHGHAALPAGHSVGCRFATRCDAFVAGVCDAGDIAILGSPPGHQVRCIRWPEIGPVQFDGAAAKPRSTKENGDILTLAGVSKEYEEHADAAGALFRRKRRSTKANDDISFSAGRGETVAIVGESGCGKSTLARLILGLANPTAGHIEFAGVDLAALPISKRKPALIAALQMVFQNPDGTLNPTKTVRQSIQRAVVRLGNQDTRSLRTRVSELMRKVQLSPELADRLPHQLSGGQKQRVAIARAFAGNPQLVVADEPVSALDVSVQATITELLQQIQEETGTTLLLISHDMGLVRSISDRVVVMYLGRLVEIGLVEDVFEPPYHPYTEALLSAIPIPDPNVPRRHVDVIAEPAGRDITTGGCVFADRCHRKIGSICETEEPPLQAFGLKHRIRCHIARSELQKIEPVFARSCVPSPVGTQGASPDCPHVLHPKGPAN